MAYDLSEVYVEQAEVKLGAKLPESYRRAMMAANGGEVATEEDDWQLYPIVDSSDKKRLSRSCNDIVTETKNSAGWDGFPKQAVAIAANSAGDLLVLLKSGKEFDPAVYVWSHETSHLFKVKNDFAELERI